MANPLGMLSNSKMGKAVGGRLSEFADQIDRNPAKAAVIGLVALPIIGMIVAFTMGASAYWGLAIGGVASLVFFAVCIDHAFSSKYGERPWFKRVHKIMEVTLKILAPLAVASVGAFMIAQGPTSMLFYVGCIGTPILFFGILDDMTLPALKNRKYKASPMPPSPTISPAAQRAQRGISS